MLLKFRGRSLGFPPFRFGLTARKPVLLVIADGPRRHSNSVENSFPFCLQAES